MPYTLNVNIDKTGRKFLLDNNETIVLVIPNNSNDIFLTACASFSPFGDVTEVVFEDEWILYASLEDIIVNWGIIQMNATHPVIKGRYYKFDDSGFDGSAPTYSNQVYGLLNDRNMSKKSLACGLGQLITVGNNAQQCPINVRSVPFNQLTFFSTNSLVWVFIASGISIGSTIPASALLSNNASFTKASVPVIIGRYLEVDLSLHSSIRFNNQTNVFELAD
jgi:hypothetical protein